MTTISLPAGTVPGTAEARAERLSVRIADTLGAVEQTWRRLESEAEASPYQRFDWVAAYAATCLTRREQFRIAILEDAGGRPALLLPLAIERRHGLKVASPLGGKHANFNLPLMRAGLAPEPAEARALLAGIGREVGADLVVSHNAPITWRSIANPLAAGGQASPSNAYKLTLSFDAEATFARVSSGLARKKLRHKERSLAKLGTVSFLEARSEAVVDRILPPGPGAAPGRVGRQGGRVMIPFLDLKAINAASRGELERIVSVPGLSKDLFEQASKSLDG